MPLMACLVCFSVIYSEDTLYASITCPASAQLSMGPTHIRKDLNTTGHSMKGKCPIHGQVL